MSKDAWLAFLLWLDAANVEELATKHVQCLALLDRLTDAELVSQLKRMIRLIEEEQVIRLGISTRQQRVG